MHAVSLWPRGWGKTLCEAGGGKQEVSGEGREVGRLALRDVPLGRTASVFSSRGALSGPSHIRRKHGAKEGRGMGQLARGQRKRNEAREAIEDLNKAAVRQHGFRCVVPWSVSTALPSRVVFAAHRPFLAGASARVFADRPQVSYVRPRSSAGRGPGAAGNRDPCWDETSIPLARRSPAAVPGRHRVTSGSWRVASGAEGSAFQLARSFRAQRGQHEKPCPLAAGAANGPLPRLSTGGEDSPAAARLVV